MAKLFQNIGLAERFTRLSTPFVPESSAIAAPISNPGVLSRESLATGLVNQSPLVNRLLAANLPANPTQRTPQLEVPVINSLFADQTSLRNRLDQPTLNSTTHLGQYFLSDQYTLPDTRGFRTSISLADRLSQPDLNSTTHLSQFFLSDTFTGNVNISPFGIFRHTSPVEIRPFGVAVNQGGTKVKPLEFTPNQGGTNPTPIGFTPEQGGTIPTPIGFTPEQGATQPTPIEFTPDQGGTSPTPIGFTPEQGETDPDLIDFEPTQGGTNPTLITAIPDQGGTEPTPIGFTPEQGGTEPTPIGFTPEQGGTEPSPIGFTPEQGSTEPTPIGFTPDQGGTTPQQITFQPNIETPILQVLGYQADRALAFALPRIKHGSADIVSGINNSNGTIYGPSSDQSDYGQNGVLNSKPISSFTNRSTLIGYVQPGDTQYTIADRIGSNLGPRLFVNKFGLPGALSLKPTLTSYDSATGNINPEQISSAGRERQEGVTDPSPQIDSILEDPLFGRNAKLNRYRTLSYGELHDISRNPRQAPNNQLMNPLALSGIKLEQGAPIINDILDDDTGSDFITFKINSIRFKAYLTSLSDTYSPSWSDIRYVGRQDTLKAFTGVTRAVSLGFKTVAMTKTDLTLMYDKLDRLVKSTVIGRTSNPEYVVGPFSRVTVGKWLTETPCVVTSLKFDANPTEYSWDVGNVRRRDSNTVPSPYGVELDGEDPDSKEMPMIVDVSLELTILGDKNGNPLNASSNTYYNV